MATRKRNRGDSYPRIGRWIAGSLVFAVIAGIAIWLLPEILVKWTVRNASPDSTPSRLDLTAAELVLAVANYRQSVLFVVGGIIAVATLLVSWAKHNLERDSNRTDRYASAITQLGNDSIAIRLGGIYALERIAQDSLRDRQTILDVLMAYVRDRARRENGAEPSGQPMETDITAAVTVVGRVSQLSRPTNKIDLSGLNLTGADFTGADLTGADFFTAELAGATFNRANLEGADLFRADLTGADLSWANLTQARLTGANLTKANLIKANLTKATLVRANLTSADLPLSNLVKATLDNVNLTAASFSGADLTEARLAEADLTGAELRKTDLTRADLTGAFVSNAYYSVVELHRGHRYRGSYTKADIARAKLTDTDPLVMDSPSIQFILEELDQSRMRESQLTDDIVHTLVTREYLEGQGAMGIGSIVGLPAQDAANDVD